MPNMRKGGAVAIRKANSTKSTGSTRKPTTSGKNAGRGSVVTYDKSRYSPKSASPTKYTTFSTPKSSPNNRPAGVSFKSERRRVQRGNAEMMRRNEYNSRRKNRKTI